MTSTTVVLACMATHEELLAALSAAFEVSEAQVILTYEEDVGWEADTRLICIFEKLDFKFSLFCLKLTIRLRHVEEADSPKIQSAVGKLCELLRCEGLTDAGLEQEDFATGDFRYRIMLKMRGPKQFEKVMVSLGGLERLGAYIPFVSRESAQVREWT